MMKFIVVFMLMSFGSSAFAEQPEFCKGFGADFQAIQSKETAESHLKNAIELEKALAAADAVQQFAISEDLHRLAVRRLSFLESFHGTDDLLQTLNVLNGMSGLYSLQESYSLAKRSSSPEQGSRLASEAMTAFSSRWAPDSVMRLSPENEYTRVDIVKKILRALCPDSL